MILIYLFFKYNLKKYILNKHSLFFMSKITFFFKVKNQIGCFCCFFAENIHFSKRNESIYVHFL